MVAGKGGHGAAREMHWGTARPGRSERPNDDTNVYGTGQFAARGVPQAVGGGAHGDLGRRAARQRSVSRAPSGGSSRSRERARSSRRVPLSACGHRTDVPRAPSYQHRDWPPYRTGPQCRGGVPEPQSWAGDTRVACLRAPPGRRVTPRRGAGCVGIAGRRRRGTAGMLGRDRCAAADRPCEPEAESIRRS